MTIELYRKKQLERLLAEKRPRERCPDCRKPCSACYCAHIRPFRPAVEFVILIHHHEARRSVATGRMAHLCLPNSHFFEGTDFSEHEGVNRILKDPSRHSVLLYPSTAAIDLASLPSGAAIVPSGKRLAVFVLDATWAQAKRMRRLSRNLAALPQIAFTPPSPSRFIVRKQPHEGCYATIEAIHHFLSWSEGGPGPHDNLLEVFAALVNHQLRFELPPLRARPRRRVRTRGPQLPAR